MADPDILQVILQALEKLDDKIEKLADKQDLIQKESSGYQTALVEHQQDNRLEIGQTAKAVTHEIKEDIEEIKKDLVCQLRDISDKVQSNADKIQAQSKRLDRLELGKWLIIILIGVFIGSLIQQNNNVQHYLTQAESKWTLSVEEKKELLSSRRRINNGLLEMMAAIQEGKKLIK